MGRVVEAGSASGAGLAHRSCRAHAAFRPDTEAGYEEGDNMAVIIGSIEKFPGKNNRLIGTEKADITDPAAK